jgi:hypothetical protein
MLAFYGHLAFLWPFYGHLVNFTAIWYILRPFGIACGDVVYFSRFGVLLQEKPWRHGIVVIASAYRTEDPGFESPQGVMF